MIRCDRTALLNVLGQQAGLSGEQLAAVRRGDVTTVLSELQQRTRPADERLEDVVDRTLRRLELAESRLARSSAVLLSLAGLLGACERCWGTNEACPTCAGDGTPGFRRPDERLAAWIHPALARLSPDSRAEPMSGEDDRKEHQHA